MKKRLFKNLLFVMVMVILCFAVAMTASAETVTGECGLEGDNLIWTFDTETGVLTIDGEGEMDNYSLYNNINKTSAPWWDYYSSMTELVIGDKVTSIGDYAFYNCDTLTSLEIPGNVKTIGDYAFYDCNELKEIILEEGIKDIGAYSFYSVGRVTHIQGSHVCIDEVILPDSLVSLGERVFSEANIDSVIIGDSLQEVSKNAFMWSEITHIELGNNIKYIREGAFRNSRCSNIIIPYGVEIIETSGFGYQRCDIESVSIPISVKIIDSYSFTTYGNNNTLSNIYYDGTIEQWEEIDISKSNDELKNATFHFGHAHEYASEITTEPTCLTTGIKTYTCECGNTYTRTLSALGHDIVIDSVVSATCTETGLTQGEHCSRCDYKVAQEETSALGHDEVIIPAVNATCTKTGLTEGLGCSRCDVIFTEQEETPMIDHNIVTVSAIAPTCTKTGLTQGEACSLCGTVFAGQEEVPVLGHDIIIDAAVSATCTETGLTQGKHCSRCAYRVAQKKTPALGHTEVFTDYVEATCTGTGLSVGKKCSVCGVDIIPQQIIPAKGHSYTDWIITSEATCETNGKKIKICSCGLFEEENILATGHSDADKNDRCDICSASLKEETEDSAEKDNVFSFLKSFLNNLLDFFRKLFGIK